MDAPGRKMGFIEALILFVPVSKSHKLHQVLTGSTMK